MIVDRYYYHQLNKQEQAIYKAFYKGAMAHQDIIPISVRGEFSQESFERIFMAMTRDNPLIYFLNQSACSIASDIFGHVAICPQYFFTKEKVKEYNRRIEKVVNELAGQLQLLTCNDYEKELRVHDWICQNVEYDYEGTDKDKISRVIASHNILGVFAYHKAQCEGIAKAVKVLLNAVDVKCIVVTGDSVKSGRSVPHAWNIVDVGAEPYALCKASAMTVGCENHEKYHKRIKEFIEKTTGDMSCFEKYGFLEKIDTRSGLERLKAFTQNFLKSGKREIDFRVPSYELNSIIQKITKENCALGEPEDIDYVLASDDDVIEFYYKHTRRYFMIKGKMLAACIKHNDIERSIKIIELLKATQMYENYNELNGFENGWERQFGLTIEHCFQEFNKRRWFAWQQDETTPDMIEQCKEIAHMCFEYLSEESIDRIKAEIRRMCPNEDGTDEYIQKLLDDVKIYCTFPKPRGKGGAPNINRMSDEIRKSFEILSNMERIDVICQIMEQFAAVKDILKPVSYDIWMSFMNHGIKDEDCIKIFRESRMVYELWLGANTREWDIKEVARKINKYGTNEEYKDFKRLVISRCGKIEGIDEYCESNNWE